MILFLKQIGVDFFIKCSFFSFSYMYFHTAYCKFTTMKILIIIFCNKIEEEKLWDNLIFGCLLIESIKSTGWKILKLLIWLNIKVPLKFCRHPKCDETPMPKSNGLHQLQPQWFDMPKSMVHMQLPKCDGLACQSPMVLHRFVKNKKVVSIYLMQ